MQIFDELNREGVGPASHTVGAFDYLNASGREEAETIRAELERWIAKYPQTHRQPLITKFRSRDDKTHHAAFFELFLHELTLRQGQEVVDIEPELPNGRAPDFLIQDAEGNRFYLEATLATGQSDADMGAERRLNDALQAIDAVSSPNFFLHLHHSGTPEAPLRVSHLRRRVQEFVGALEYPPRDDRPMHFTHEEAGIRFLIDAVPKHTPRDGGRAIGTRNIPGGIITPHAPIRKAVRDKAGRYGEVDLPLVIAVNAMGEYTRKRDAIDALFGTVAVVHDADGNVRPGRNRDGAWHDVNGPAYTRCSALIFTKRLRSWSVGQRTGHLIHNPWSQNPLVDSSFQIERNRVTEGRLNILPGAPFHSILELGENWPEDVD